MADKEIQIMAEPTPNPNSLKFTLDRPIIEKGSAMINSAAEAEDSPLAKRLFGLGEVSLVFAFSNFISVTKTDAADWRDLSYKIGDAIREHITSGEPAFSENTIQTGAKTDTDKKIIDVIDSIRPAVQGDGGDIIFISYENGIVSVQLQGACSGCPSSTMTLKSALEQRIVAAVPEVQEVVAI